MSCILSINGRHKSVYAHSRQGIVAMTANESEVEALRIYGRWNISWNPMGVCCIVMCIELPKMVLRKVGNNGRSDWPQSGCFTLARS
jgi:hypothetical protein